MKKNGGLSARAEREMWDACAHTHRYKYTHTHAYFTEPTKAFKHRQIVLYTSKFTYMYMRMYMFMYMYKSTDCIKRTQDDYVAQGEF